MEEPCYLDPSKSTDMSLWKIPTASILQNQPIWFMQDPYYFQFFNNREKTPPSDTVDYY